MKRTIIIILVVSILGGTALAFTFINGSTTSLYTLLEDQTIGYSLQLPPTFTCIGGIPMQTSCSRENKNTSEVPNRDTPNGFNTASVDSLIAIAYPNTIGESPTVQDFLSWHDATEPSLQLLSDNIEIEGNTLSIELADGIGSVGLYQYFFGPRYIVLVGTDDISRSEWNDLVSTFQWTTGLNE